MVDDVPKQSRVELASAQVPAAMISIIYQINRKILDVGEKWKMWSRGKNSEAWHQSFHLLMRCWFHLRMFSSAVAENFSNLTEPEQKGWIEPNWPTQTVKPNELPPIVTSCLKQTNSRDLRGQKNIFPNHVNWMNGIDMLTYWHIVILTCHTHRPFFSSFLQLKINRGIGYWEIEVSCFKQARLMSFLLILIRVHISTKKFWSGEKRVPLLSGLNPTLNFRFLDTLYELHRF